MNENRTYHNSMLSKRRQSHKNYKDRIHNRYAWSRRPCIDTGRESKLKVKSFPILRKTIDGCIKSVYSFSPNHSSNRSMATAYLTSGVNSPFSNASRIDGTLALHSGCPSYITKLSTSIRDIDLIENDAWNPCNLQLYPLAAAYWISYMKNLVGRNSNYFSEDNQKFTHCQHCIVKPHEVRWRERSMLTSRWLLILEYSNFWNATKWRVLLNLIVAHGWSSSKNHTRLH